MAAARAAGSVPPIVPWVLGTVGAWLAYSAVTGRNPITELRAALTGSASPGPSRTTFGGVAPSSEGGTDTPAALPVVQRSFTGGGILPRNSPELVAIGQGGHKLRRDAATAFATAEAIFGAKIPVTDSWRDPQTQAAGHAADPGRFASADKSAHPKGLAVDVNLTAIPGMRAPSRGKDDGNDVWRRLFAAFTAAGWCNPRGGTRGDGKEPWHWSFGGCA